jgi:RNA polymerase sigma factor (sigma-70 family)
MSSSALAAGLRHLRGKLAAQQPSSDSDEQLLHAFTSRRDDNAFAALVRRHGPMVLHVCRRVLGHEQDAEDAFQATFLVLAQNVASLRNKASLASFLYGTAYRIAMKAKQTAARRRKHEGQAPARLPQNLTDELSWREVRMLLEEEIARLPEKYRVVFVLFYLENLSREETARRLGLKDAAVAKRLAEARKRLGQRLARRGIELTAVLSAAALATPPASALPAGLTATTIKAALVTVGGEGLSGLVSASVAELTRCATTALVASKAKIVMICLLTATLLAGVGVWTWGSQALSESDQQVAKTPATPSRSVQGQKAQTPQQEQRDSITVAGRVLDPDGTPIKGARLYWPRSPKKNPKSEEDIEFPVRARTDADGQFRFELPRSDFHPDWNFALVAAADGYGVDAVELSEDDSAAEVTLRLVKDQPIEGRIVSTEGKPLASVRVRVAEISAMQQGRLDDFLMAWQQDWGFAFGRFPRHRFLMPEQTSSPALTDKEGRFRIAGAGADRLVGLRLSGPGIARQSLQIVNRAGFDAAAVNKTALDRAHVEIGNSRPPLLYGPTFTYVASAGRRIEGTVRQAGSGKPVEGYVIYCCDSVCGGAVSDKDGCYQLEGAPKRKQYLLNVEPPAGSSWLPTGARLKDEEGLRPLHVDFTVARGITIRGRVLDRTTGRGVRGEVHFVLLPGNNFAGKPGFNRYHYGILGTKTETDGQFQLAVIPGPSVLMFQAHAGEKANGGQELNPYKQAEFDAKERERVQLTERGNDERYFTTIDRSIQFLNSQNAVKYIDLAPDAGTAKCDLFVDRGAMQTINIEDADGKPLTGTMASGVTAKYPTACTIKDAACTAFALNPKMPRRLYFFHAQRQLAGSLTVRGDEKEPLAVRLLPVGTVTGRLLNREGQPIVGAFVDLHTLEGTYGSARELYRVLHQRRPPIRTDKDGRFRLEGIMPDVQFMLHFSQGRTFFGGEPPIGVRQVKPGETLDLGAIRVKPAG